MYGILIATLCGAIISLAVGLFWHIISFPLQMFGIYLFSVKNDKQIITSMMKKIDEIGVWSSINSFEKGTKCTRGVFIHKTFVGYCNVIPSTSQHDPSPSIEIFIITKKKVFDMLIGIESEEPVDNNNRNNNNGNNNIGNNNIDVKKKDDTVMWDRDGNYFLETDQDPC